LPLPITTSNVHINLPWNCWKDARRLQPLRGWWQSPNADRRGERKHGLYDDQLGASGGFESSALPPAGMGQAAYEQWTVCRGYGLHCRKATFPHRQARAVMTIKSLLIERTFHWFQQVERQSGGCKNSGRKQARSGEAVGSPALSSIFSHCLQEAGVVTSYLEVNHRGKGPPLDEGDGGKHLRTDGWRHSCC